MIISQKWAVIAIKCCDSENQTSVQEMLFELHGMPILLHSMLAFVETGEDKNNAQR